MTTLPEVKTKYLRRSVSMRDCDAVKTKNRTSRSNSAVSMINKNSQVSKSTDDILVLNNVTDTHQQGVLMFFNGFCRTEALELQTLMGSSLEDTLQACRERSKSFHDKRQLMKGRNSDRFRPLRRIQSFCAPRTSKSAMEKTYFPSTSVSNIKRTLSSLEPKKRDTSEDNDVQLRRCISLYERSRQPHTHCRLDKTPTRASSATSPKPKPSPWAYGSTTRPRTANPSRASSSSLGSSGTLRKSSSQTLSSDSYDSKRSSRLSLASMNSEFDLTSSCISLRTNGYASSPRNVEQANSKSRQSPPTPNGSPQSKQSMIPRPVRPQSAPPDRPNTPAPATVTRTTPVMERSWPSGVAKKRLNRSRSTFITAPRQCRANSQRESGNQEIDSPSTDKEIEQNAEVPQYNEPRYYFELRKQEDKVIHVPEVEDDYPDVAPSHRQKSQIFNPRELIQVDQHALKAPEVLLDSFVELLDYLLDNLTHDLARVRAIYRWVVSQNIPLELDVGEINVDSPLGFLYNIREKRATYSELFATLCRRAGIPCVIVYGVAKSVAYTVGDRISHKKMKNSWNAVYLDNEWRFVHPYWARQSVRGYSSGCWAVVESDEFHSEGSESRQLIAHTVNDFFFLTDPEKFITKCFPDDPSWQLLRKQITQSEFEHLPFLQPAFYDLQLKVKSHDSCIIRSENGKVDLCIEVPESKINRYSFKYKLFIHRDWEAEGEYDQILLDRYLLHYKDNDLAHFEIRFPVSGTYKLEIHCYDSQRTLSSNWICDYRIICPQPMPKCDPLPVVPSIGWGPGSILEEEGLESLTHKTGVVNIDAEPVTFLRFAVSKEKELSVEAQLVANKMSHADLLDHVTVEQDDEHAVVKVAPPCEGEYALQVYVKQKDSEKRKNVCNYLLQRNNIVEDPELADIRRELNQATESGELDALTLWTDKFMEKGMEDRGELARARKKLHLAKLNRDIREAIARKDLGLLEKTLQSCSDTSIRNSLGHLAGEAEAMRSRLRRLKRLQHAVLEMDQKTISEMRSYPKPPPAVHGVMAATFLLLGNPEGQLKNWRKIQGLISKRGKESLKRRVADFRVDSVPDAVMTRARVILAKYDIETVQIASAGAATFYQWAISMAGEAGF